MWRNFLPVLTTGLAFAAVSPVQAQVDFRNLDGGHPAPVEDAYPVERFAGEAQLSYHFADEGFATVHAAELGIEYGVALNTEVGVSVTAARSEAGDAVIADIAGVRLHALYNFNTDSRGLPALSLSTEAALPAGALAGDAVRVLAKAIATRNLGRYRVHLNAGAGFGGDDAATVDPLPEWTAGLALERTFIRQSALLLGHIGVEQHRAENDPSVVGGLGVRWQWTPLIVFDGGIQRRLGSTGPDLALTIGLSRTFGIRALMGVD